MRNKIIIFALNERLPAMEPCGYLRWVWRLFTMSLVAICDGTHVIKKRRNSAITTCHYATPCDRRTRGTVFAGLHTSLNHRTYSRNQAHCNDAA